MRTTRLALSPWFAFLVLLLTRSASRAADDAVPPIETVLIPGATFTMGTPLKKGDNQYHDDEAPLEVAVETFRIGKFPVAAEQMCAYLNSESARKLDRTTLYNNEELNKFWRSSIVLDEDGNYLPRKKKESAPANQVTWQGAVLFCQWYSVQMGKQYRLPSEAEWELAAAGPEGRRWPWGEGDPSTKHGERYIRPGWTGHRKIPLFAVGSHPANATKEGVFDLLAYQNDEWCANKFVAHPTVEQVTDTQADLEDLESARAVRGCAKGRDYERGPWWIRGTTYGYGRHEARPWTRQDSDEITKVYSPAWRGFRVVEVTSTSASER